MRSYTTILTLKMCLPFLPSAGTFASILKQNNLTITSIQIHVFKCIFKNVRLRRHIVVDKKKKKKKVTKESFVFALQPSTPERQKQD